MMLGREWDRKRIQSIMEIFKETWIEKFYITIPIFFLVWSFQIPWIVYDMLFATILSIVYSKKIKHALKHHWNTWFPQNTKT